MEKKEMAHVVNPATTTAFNLRASAYMGHKIFVNGKPKTWRQLLNIKPEGKLFNIDSLTREGINNIYHVTALL